MAEFGVDEINNISDKIIGAAIEVHRTMGSGLLESVYEEGLCYEFELQGIRFERQKVIPIIYKSKTFDNGFRADLVVAGKVIVELKSVSAILPVHEAQLLNYLKLSNLWLGLLINFIVPVLRNGIKRIVSGYINEPSFTI